MEDNHGKLDESTPAHGDRMDTKTEPYMQYMWENDSRFAVEIRCFSTKMDTNWNNFV